MKHARAEIGIDSVPTFIIGDRIVSGLLSNDREREINSAVAEVATNN